VEQAVAALLDGRGLRGPEVERGGIVGGGAPAAAARGVVVGGGGGGGGGGEDAVERLAAIRAVDGGGWRRLELWTAAAAAIAQGRGRGIKPGRSPIASVR
jgi:hypothetical protein